MSPRTLRKYRLKGEICFVNMHGSRGFFYTQDHIDDFITPRIEKAKPKPRREAATPMSSRAIRDLVCGLRPSTACA